MTIWDALHDARGRWVSVWVDQGQPFSGYLKWDPAERGAEGECLQLASVPNEPHFVLVRAINALLVTPGRNGEQ